MQGWINVREWYSRALEQGTLPPAPPAAPYAAAAPASSWYTRGTGAVSVQSAHASRGGIQGWIVAHLARFGKV